MQDGVLREDTFFGSGILALTAPESSAVVGNISITAGENISADSGGIVQLPFNHSDSKAALVTLSAGQDILSTLSGIVGENITITKAKNVIGLLFAQENINIGHVTGAIDVTALAGGNIGISDSQSATVSGQLTGGAGVSVDVGTGAITATIISTGGTTSTTGDASGAKIGAFHGVAFQAAEKTVQDAEQTVAQDIQTTLVDDEVKRGNKRPLLAKSTGRVTILLPSAPSPSPNPNPNPNPNLKK